MKGDAVEAAHSGFQAAVVGINALNVENAVQHPRSLLDIDLAVGDAGFADEGLRG